MTQQMTTDNFIQPAIPRFDGHYDHWSMLMENFLRSKEYWGLVDPGYVELTNEASQSEAQRKKNEEIKLKDLKVKNYLFQAIDRTILDTILNKTTAKEIWDAMKKKYEGNARVKRSHLQALHREFETFEMRNGKGKFQRHRIEEQALKVTHDRGRGRGRGAYRGRGRGRERARFNKETLECYKCHKLGHFQYECPENTEANYAEFNGEDEMLLMAYAELNGAKKEDAWFLDSGCSNHVCGDQAMFSELDEGFRHTVKLRNNTKMNVVGIGSVNLLLNGISHIVTKCPTLAVKDVTPEEAWSGLKPSVEHFHVFGCIAHVHVPKIGRTKLDNRSNTCVLLGVSEEPKVDLEWSEDEEGMSENENGVSADEEVSDEEIREEEANSSEGEERERRPPSWMSDYVSGEGLSEDEVHMAQVVSNDPLYFEQAVKST
ncbi:hypothetical protein Salat_0288100 [Sesamum alatum]|uniref:CCHC-type domain-containing protein n=1 Tax=Sesamum alatum TaxID=300844 RepID=A0AAE2CYP7_9LAMI|nr:hypothetical protein Salat_0288100 [Sesamum alatum]